MPNHPYYEPTNEFIERHGLHIDEAETWVELFDAEDWLLKAKRSIRFRKDSGLIVLCLHVKQQPTDPFNITPLFKGYLPDEDALESVIKWTKWAE